MKKYLWLAIIALGAVGASAAAISPQFKDDHVRTLAPPDQIQVSPVDRGNGSLKPGQTLTIQLTSAQGAVNSADIMLELIQNGNVKVQQNYSNQKITSQADSFSITTPTEPGFYQLAVIVKDNQGRTIGSFDNFGQIQIVAP